MIFIIRESRGDMEKVKSFVCRVVWGIVLNEIFRSVKVRVLEFFI